MKHDAHTQCVMTDTDSFYVRICGCGVVHLCFGPTTLNLSKEATFAVTQTLMDVTKRICLEEAPKKSPIVAAEGNLIQGKFRSLPAPQEG